MSNDQIITIVIEAVVLLTALAGYHYAFVREKYKTDKDLAQKKYELDRQSDQEKSDSNWSNMQIIVTSLRQELDRLKKDFILLKADNLDLLEKQAKMQKRIRELEEIEINQDRVINNLSHNSFVLKNIQQSFPFPATLKDHKYKMRGLNSAYEETFNAVAHEYVGLSDAEYWGKQGIIFAQNDLEAIEHPDGYKIFIESTEKELTGEDFGEVFSIKFRRVLEEQVLFGSGAFFIPLDKINDDLASQGYRIIKMTKDE